MKKETRGPLEEIPFLSWISFPFWHATGKKFLSALRRARIQASKAGFLMEKQRTTKELLASYSVNSHPPRDRQSAKSMPSSSCTSWSKMALLNPMSLCSPGTQDSYRAKCKWNGSTGEQTSGHRDKEPAGGMAGAGVGFSVNFRIAELREHLLRSEKCSCFLKMKVLPNHCWILYHGVTGRKSSLGKQSNLYKWMCNRLTQGCK